MGDRKRRSAAPSLEPMEGRDLLSGLLVALHPTGVPYLSPSEVASIATTKAHAQAAGHVSALAGAGGSGGGGGGSGSGSGQNGSGSATIPSGGTGLYVGNGVVANGSPQGPNAAVTFPTAPLLGAAPPTPAELAREKFVAHFYGPMTVQPPRFLDQSKIINMRGLGGSTTNFFLHGDYDLSIVFPAGFDPKNPGGTQDPSQPTPNGVPPVTGFAFLDDKNNNSGGVVGLDLLADPTSFDAKGRPTRLTFTSDPNVYGGIFFVSQSSGTVTIAYHKNSASAFFNGRIYTSGLTSPFENVDLYRRGGRLTARG